MLELTIIWNGSLSVAEWLRAGIALRNQFSCAEESPCFRLRTERQPSCSFGGIRRWEDFRRRVNFFFLNSGLGFQFRDLPPGSTAASMAYCTIPRFPKRSCFGRQVFLVSTTRGSPLAAKGGTMNEKWWSNGAWDMHPGFFYMGPIILLPFRRKACWGFLSSCKNPTASVGFEAANLGIRGQHATSATPKPLGGE